MRKLMIKLILKYQNNKGVHQKPHCRFYPTCSNYALECYKRFNFLKASILVIYRIIRCNPLNKGGYDPVPEKRKHLIKESANLYYLPFEENRDRPSLYYIINNNEPFIFDIGASKKHLKSFYREIKKAHLEKPKYAILSHYHWDHTFSIDSLRIKAYANEETINYLKGLNGLPKKAILAQLDLFSHDHFKLEYKHHNLKISKEPFNINCLNDHNILFIPSFHANSIGYYLARDKAIIAGDSLCGKIIGYDFLADKAIIKKQYQYFAGIDFKYIYFSHANKITKDDLLADLAQKL